MCSTVLSSVLKDIFHHLSAPTAEESSDAGVGSDSAMGSRIRRKTVFGSLTTPRSVYLYVGFHFSSSEGTVNSDDILRLMS